MLQHADSALLQGESMVIDHILCGDRIRVSVRCGGAPDGMSAARLLGDYTHFIQQTEALCREEQQIVTTREQYAAMISFNHADLEQYGEEF